MTDKQYVLTGWLAIAAGGLVFPHLALSLVADMGMRLGPARMPFVALGIVVGIASTALGLTALYRLRVLLNSEFHFHDVDAIITFVIFAAATITLVASAGRIFAAPGDAHTAAWFLVPMALIGVSLGIASIVFGVRILRLQDDLFGLKKPCAYLSIGEGICFTSILLAPAGMILLALGYFVLGYIFFRAGGQSHHQVEFV